METVRKINQVAKRAGSDALEVDDYLRAVTSDPMTEWFTELLSEKNKELKREQQRSGELARALRAWYQAKDATEGHESGGEAELELVKVLRDMEILNR